MLHLGAVEYTLRAYDGTDSNTHSAQYDTVIKAIEDLKTKVVDAIDSKETGITDTAIYSSVKQSARKEQKSTGRSPF